MKHRKGVPTLRVIVVRVLVLGYCIYLAPSCTAGAPTLMTPSAPGPVATEQPASTAPSNTAAAAAPTTPAPTAPATAAAPPFTTYGVFDPEWDIEPVDYSFEPGILPTETITEFLQLSRLAYGELDTSESAFDVQIIVKNTGDTPLAVDLDQHYFSFEDDQGRKAKLVYFCCDVHGEMLPPGDTRSLELVFRMEPGWEGKEVSAQWLVFRARGLEPVVSAAWQIPALATAD